MAKRIDDHMLTDEEGFDLEASMKWNDNKISHSELDIIGLAIDLPEELRAKIIELSLRFIVAQFVQEAAAQDDRATDCRVASQCAKIECSKVLSEFRRLPDQHHDYIRRYALDGKMFRIPYISYEEANPDIGDDLPFPP